MLVAVFCARPRSWKKKSKRYVGKTTGAENWTLKPKPPVHTPQRIFLYVVIIWVWFPFKRDANYSSLHQFKWCDWSQNSYFFQHRHLSLCHMHDIRLRKESLTKISYVRDVHTEKSSFMQKKSGKCSTFLFEKWLKQLINFFFQVVAINFLWINHCRSIWIRKVNMRKCLYTFTSKTIRLIGTHLSTPITGNLILTALKSASFLYICDDKGNM